MTTYDALRMRANEVWRQMENPQRLRITVVDATCANAAGARDTLAAIRSEVARRRINIDIGITGCPGLCYAEPLVEISWPGGLRIWYEHITSDKVERLLDATLGQQGGTAPELALAVVSGQADGIPPLASLDFWKIQERRLMANCGVIDPENIDHYIARGGYEGLVKALSMSQEEIIKEVLDAGLWGRGGAAFPAGRKWDFLRVARGEPKYILVNADEGDPGAWVNRVTMEGDPHLLIEGILIAARATGATRSFIYIRDEYPLAIERMRKALAQAYERGLVGRRILSTDFSCEIEVFRGAGSYVCGEETGLIASIEGMRGMPKIRPPFPAQSGVFGKPSNVNNVETIANAPLILRHGAAWYGSVGTETNKGTKMFSLSGSINRVGCLEVPLGTSMEKVLMEAGGGLPEGRTLKAIQPGGPLGGILPASELGLPLEPQPFREKDVLMGSGGLVVVDDTACIVDLCIYFSWFAEDESCGRCTTCHGGTQRMVEIFRRMANGQGRASDIEVLRLLRQALQWANCVHGQFAPAAAMNAIQYFMDELQEHIQQKRCRAKVCKGLIRYEMDAPVSDPRADEAAAICPTNAIVDSDGRWVIDQEKCIKCGACKEIAPDYVRVEDAYPDMVATLTLV